MEYTKQERILSIFFRALRGEELSVRRLADEYGTSAKSITRDINDIKAFLSDQRELAGNVDLVYSHQRKYYYLSMEDFLSSRELFALVEVLIGARAFSKMETLQLVGKLKRFTSAEDRTLLETLVRNEVRCFSEVKHDCESVQDNLWQLAHCIRERREISVEYYRMDRACVTHRLRPASVMFADHYFYLIGFLTQGDPEKPIYFRVDRIRHITVHRTGAAAQNTPSFDEGELRRRSLYMWPGRLQVIRFEFSGPSVQAVLDKLPTARILERTGGSYIVEAEVYGDGIRMWLLGQGRWVKVLEPAGFAAEMREELEQTLKGYTVGDREEGNEGDAGIR